MLQIRNIQVTVKHSTLYLRRHNHGPLSFHSWKQNSIIKRLEANRSAKGGTPYGTKVRHVLAALLAMLGGLVLVMEWAGCPMSNIILYEENLVSFLRIEAGFSPNDENDDFFLPSGCDYTKGTWVRSSRKPLYSGKDCTRWLATMWACRLSNRKDFQYENFRWQPDECDLPTFNGRTFLRRMRSKTIAFVGDSLGRQQFQSLMCLITNGRDKTEVEDVGAEYGLTLVPGAIRPEGWVYRFLETNTTVLFYWSASLCDLEPFNRSDPSTEVAMHLDRPPVFLRENFHKFDVLIINTGPHWNMGKFQKNRWKMHMEGKLVDSESKLMQDIKHAYNFTVHSVIRWLDERLETNRTKAFYRTLSPRHFFQGDWDSGGRCDNTRLNSGGQRVMKGPLIDAVAESAVRGTKIKLINITGMSHMRDEAHISKYTLKAKNGSQDCLHWCLPGVPDTWNEILYAQALHNDELDKLLMQARASTNF